MPSPQPIMRCAGCGKIYDQAVGWKYPREDHARLLREGNIVYDEREFCSGCRHLAMDRGQPNFSETY